LGNAHTIQGRALTLCDAIRKHAELCDIRPRDAVVIEEAAEKVTQAVAEYADIILKEKRATVIFEDDADDVFVAGPGGDASGEIIIDDRYTIRVLDSENLMRLVESRYGRPAASVQDALRTLCDEEGWNVWSYPGDALAVNLHSVEAI
jgi:hypothetical protein